MSVPLCFIIYILLVFPVYKLVLSAKDFWHTDNDPIPKDSYAFLFENCGQGPVDCLPVNVNRYTIIGKEGDGDKNKTKIKKPTTKRKLSRTKRLINGEGISYGQIPWLASIIDGDRKIICNAALIAKRYVVTSAHCFHKVHSDDALGIPPEIKVRLGGHVKDSKDLEVQEQIHDIRNLCIHKDFNVKEFDYYWNWNLIVNDLAVLELEQPVNISAYVRPICLPHPLSPRPQENSHNTSLSRECYISSFGDFSREDARDSSSNPIAALEAHIMGYKPRPKCGRYNSGFRTAFKHKSVACMEPWETYTKHTMDVGVCFGDRGAPLSCYNNKGKWSLYSIITGGSASCLPFSGSAFGVDMWNLKWQTIDMILALKEKKGFHKYCRPLSFDQSSKTTSYDDFDFRKTRLKYPDQPDTEPPDY